MAPSPHAPLYPSEIALAPETKQWKSICSESRRRGKDSITTFFIIHVFLALWSGSPPMVLKYMVDLIYMRMYVTCTSMDTEFHICNEHRISSVCYLTLFLSVPVNITNIFVSVVFAVALRMHSHFNLLLFAGIISIVSGKEIWLHYWCYFALTHLFCVLLLLSVCCGYHQISEAYC